MATTLLQHHDLHPEKMPHRTPTKVRGATQITKAAAFRKSPQHAAEEGKKSPVNQTPKRSRMVTFVDGPKHAAHAAQHAAQGAAADAEPASAAAADTGAGAQKQAQPRRRVQTFNFGALPTNNGRAQSPTLAHAMHVCWFSSG